MSLQHIDPWWKRIGCNGPLKANTGEEAAMCEEIKELREHLSIAEESVNVKLDVMDLRFMLAEALAPGALLLPSGVVGDITHRWGITSADMVAYGAVESSRPDEVLDYEDLLKRYMKLVIECEGTDFLMYAHEHPIRQHNVSFTDEEIRVLGALSREVSA